MGFGVDNFEQFTVFLVAPVSVHEDVNTTSLHYIDPARSIGSNQLLVGREEPLLESFGYLRLHVLGPVAEEEDAGFDNSKGVLVMDL
jgi:hypothetical protein